MGCLAPEDPQQETAEERDQNDDFPRLGPGAGEQDQQDEEGNRVAENVFQVRMQEWHGRDPDQPDHPTRHDAVLIERGNEPANEED